MQPQLSHRSKNYALRSETVAEPDQMQLHVERVVNGRMDGSEAARRIG